MAEDVSLSLRIQFKIDPAATWAANDPTLLAGEIGIESDTNKFKFGDGVSSWNDLSYAAVSFSEFESQVADTRTKVFMASRTSELTEDMDVINAVFESGGTFDDITPQEGDIFIVLDTIDGTEVQYPYVYNTRINDPGWVAILGTFDASRVILDRDIKLAGAYDSVGNVAISDGTISKGITVADLFEKIFTKEINPEVVLPSGTLTLYADGVKVDNGYEIGSNFELSYASTFNPGSYSYNSSVSSIEIIPISGTGVEVTSYTASDNAATEFDADLTASGTVGQITLTEDNYTFTFNINYSAGYYALTNMDNIPSTIVQIPAGTLTFTKTLYAHRYIFYGYSYDSDDLDADAIRALNSIVSETTTINIEEDTTATRIILALPSDRSLSSVIMPSSLNVDVTAEFIEQATKISVPGANGYSSDEYTIYVYNPAIMGGSYTITVV